MFVSNGIQMKKDIFPEMPSIIMVKKKNCLEKCDLIKCIDF